MAVKTNYKINNKDYYRISASFGRREDGKLIRKYFYGKSKKEAEQKLEEYKKSLENGIKPIKNLFLAPTMHSWLFEVVNISNKIKPSTFERYEGLYRNYIKTSSLARVNIKDITSLQIQKYYNNLFKKENKTTSQINSVNKLLKHFFFYCIKEDYILKNPCSNIEIPGKTEYKEKEINVFNDDEIKAIVCSTEKKLIRYIATVCVCTGLRRGECLGLKWSDLNYNTMEICVNRSVKTVGKFKDNGDKYYETIVQFPKTKNSVRTIPLPTSLINTFKELKIIQSENILKAGDSYNKSNKDFIFLSADGNLIDNSNLSRAWKRFLKRLNIKYIKFHALRHTYATKQFEAGLPLKTVSVLLGHSDISVTANIYTHVMKKEKEKSIDIITSVLKMC